MSSGKSACVSAPVRTPSALRHSPSAVTPSPYCCRHRVSRCTVKQPAVKRSIASPARPEFHKHDTGIVDRRPRSPCEARGRGPSASASSSLAACSALSRDCRTPPRSRLQLDRSSKAASALSSRPLSFKTAPDYCGRPQTPGLREMTRRYAASRHPGCALMQDIA